MTWERQRTYDFDAGMEKGARQRALASARQLLAMQLLTPEQIAQAVQLPLEQVIALQSTTCNE